MHPNPDYTTAVAFLKKQSEEIGLDFNVVSPGTMFVSLIGRVKSVSSLVHPVTKVVC